MSRRKVAELDTPFSSVEWPVISQQDQDAILELLCTLLEPIGHHRRDHVVVSSGKRNRRRKQGHSQQEGLEEGTAAKTKDDLDGSGAQKDAPLPAAPLPELARYIDVGLVSVTRELAKRASPKEPTSAPVLPTEPAPVGSTTLPSDAPYAAVFVVRSAHPSAFYSHLPQMVAVASPSPLLVGFSKACEDRLSVCLGIPRVSSIALRAGAPQSRGLLEFLQEKVPPVDARWLTEATAGQFRETQIHMADVPVGPKRKKK